MKAQHASEAKRLQDIPNIGKAAEADFKLLGIHTPQAIKNQDGFALYQALCKATKQRHDPCVLDTMLAAVDFMNGAPAKPWWAYTALRKRDYPSV